MHLAIFVILVILGTGLAYNLIQSAIPAGTPRQIMLIALTAAAGLILFDRVARAAPPAPSCPLARSAAQGV